MPSTPEQGCATTRLPRSWSAWGLRDLPVQVRDAAHHSSRPSAIEEGRLPQLGTDRTTSAVREAARAAVEFRRRRRKACRADGRSTSAVACASLKSPMAWSVAGEGPQSQTRFGQFIRSFRRGVGTGRQNC